jgi:hypothetical protein
MVLKKSALKGVLAAVEGIFNRVDGFYPLLWRERRFGCQSGLEFQPLSIMFWFFRTSLLRKVSGCRAAAAGSAGAGSGRSPPAETLQLLRQALSVSDG